MAFDSAELSVLAYAIGLAALLFLAGLIAVGSVLWIGLVRTRTLLGPSE